MGVKYEGVLFCEIVHGVLCREQGDKGGAGV